MQVYKGSILIQYSDKIEYYKNRLQSESIVIQDSDDHIEHIALFVAWNKIGGNIFVKSSILPKDQDRHVLGEIKDLKINNSIVFHTSGTTGLPKLVVHTKKQILAAAEMTTEASDWNSSTRFLNLIPAATSGFWHIVMPASLKHNSSLILSSRSTVLDDISLGNLIILVPALIDQLRIHFKDQQIDFSHYTAVMAGASQVLERHAAWCFSKNAPQFIHLYGMTETCSPVLCRRSESLDKWTTALNLTPLGDNQVKIEDSVLWIKGKSLAEGLPEWFNTEDLWTLEEDRIRFAGRINDRVKLNGYMANLLLIENEFEKEEFDLGEVLAVPRNSLGSDWIELYYTNQNAVIKKEEFVKKTKHILLECSIPKKYTWVNSIKKNNYGKKLRNS